LLARRAGEADKVVDGVLGRFRGHGCKGALLSQVRKSQSMAKHGVEESKRQARVERVGYRIAFPTGRQGVIPLSFAMISAASATGSNYVYLNKDCFIS
jgi:hypothetical protein